MNETSTAHEKTFGINGIKLVMVYIPAGEFMMGSEHAEDAQPVHRVNIEQAFYMGKFPVTQAQYKAVMGKNPSYFKDSVNLPVEKVSWNKSQEFCQKLSALLEQEFRLPSEAEWEYACRAGTTSRYWWGDEMEDARCWHRNNSGGYSKSVGEDEILDSHINPFGLCDMSGNLWEWCEDNWAENYKIPRTQAAYKKANKYKTLRGGSWLNEGVNASSAFRGKFTKTNYLCGFRICLNV
ncbi:MAG: formylglycine-generating enzyme family protein [Thiotrichaceae bacterium]|nr:formylglycine-generating enzyme family protein [Thiotrichaceae bacterium]